MFRLQGKKFFLTFPQCEQQPSAAADITKELLGAKYSGSIIAQEKHADGADHLHVYIECKTRMDIRKADYFDVIGGKHGNYQVVRNADAVKNYVTKESPGLVDNIAMPTDKKIIVYANAVTLAADYAKKRARPQDVTFSESIAALVSDGYVFANSCARLEYEWAQRAFKVRVTGKINISDVQSMFKH